MSNEDRSIVYPGGRTGVLLIHGLGGTPDQMRYIARGLARAGYTVRCPQLTGHCGTLEEFMEPGWTDWYASCQEAFEKLQTDCDHVIIGGLSGGSLLGLNLMADNPGRALGAIAYAPPFKLNGWSIPWYSFLINLVRHRWFADMFLQFSESAPYGIKDKRVRDMVTRQFDAGITASVGQPLLHGGLMLELRWLAKEVSKKLGSITAPVLVFHPREDDRANLKNAAHLQENLGGMCETIVLDDSYHFLTIDRQRDLVLERTLAYADSLVPALDAANDGPVKIQAAE